MYKEEDYPQAKAVIDGHVVDAGVLPPNGKGKQQMTTASTNPPDELQARLDTLRANDAGSGSHPGHNQPAPTNDPLMCADGTILGYPAKPMAFNDYQLKDITPTIQRCTQ